MYATSCGAKITKLASVILYESIGFCNTEHSFRNKLLMQAAIRVWLWLNWTLNLKNGWFKMLVKAVTVESTKWFRTRIQRSPNRRKEKRRNLFSGSAVVDTPVSIWPLKLSYIYTRLLNIWHCWHRFRFRCRLRAGGRQSTVVTCAPPTKPGRVRTWLLVNSNPNLVFMTGVSFRGPSRRRISRKWCEISQAKKTRLVEHFWTLKSKQPELFIRSLVDVRD